jgi:hypothetical protein
VAGDVQMIDNAEFEINQSPCKAGTSKQIYR